MRKPRDYDAELTALADKAKRLQTRKLIQLGELVAATAADTLPIDILAGVLLSAVETKDATVQEAWRKRGDAFFSAAARSRLGARNNTGRAPSNNGSAASTAGADRTP